MNIFGLEITRQIREDAFFVLAIALLVVGAGQLVKRAFDTTGQHFRVAVVEQKITQFEEKLSDDYECGNAMPSVQSQNKR